MRNRKRRGGGGRTEKEKEGHTFQGFGSNCLFLSFVWTNNAERHHWEQTNLDIIAGKYNTTHEEGE